MIDPLKRTTFSGPEGPVVLAIMDGVGIAPTPEGDAVAAATTPHLDWLRENTPTTQLRAHGNAVGMPSEADMGNSEVGHNAIGCGRVFAQGAKLVNEAIASEALFRGDAWTSLVDNARQNRSTLHFVGLLSDGNVHSHVDQLQAMLRRAREEGVDRVRLHALLDGRDVGGTSALDYIGPMETLLAELSGAGDADYRIASGGGRMQITMDRYNADWDMVQRGWDAHVHGKGRRFASATEAIETFRKENPGVIDQDLPAFVVADDDQPVGPVADCDSVIVFNFRGDRAIEISRAFEEDEFSEFDRGRRPRVAFAGMMQYDGDLKIPKTFLVDPPAIDRTLGEYLAAASVRQFAVSETQKYGHVTYFFNGNRSGKFSSAFEEYEEIPSDRVSFDQRPWMKGAEITDSVLRVIAAKEADFVRLNYPNGDMVGHTGNFQASTIAVEAVDLCVGRLMKAVEKANGILVVTADHGNADDMFERDGKTGAIVTDPLTGLPKGKTCHSLNPVPVHVYDPSGCAKLQLAPNDDLGISSLAATCLRLLGFEPPADYTPAIVEIGA